MTTDDSTNRAGLTALDRLVGLPIYAVHHLERGTVLVAEAKGGGKCIVEGRGLLRGVAYTSVLFQVERGYLTGAMGERCKVIDAVSGRVVDVVSKAMTEVEERYQHPTIEQAVLRESASHGDLDAMRELARMKDPVYRDAFREACIDVLGEDPDDWR